MNQKLIRVLIVDDSVFMRSMLKSALANDDGIEVIGTAQNGREGLKKIGELKPDVVTLDIEMPGVDGLEVLETVMKSKPLPIVMVSTKTQAGAEATLKALRLGAVDYVAKPLGEKSATLGGFRKSVVRAVLTAAASNRSTLGSRPSGPKKIGKAGRYPNDVVVAIGISAGGPATLHELLPAFPSHFPPIVITQHMPADFVGAFAKRLNEECQMAVKKASTNDHVVSGQILIAPGDKHLRVIRQSRHLVAMLDDGPKVSGFRPSVDVLFESIASAAGDRSVGVVMTGMGFDGSAGIRLLKGRGSYTISQDRESSIVYGMPKAAFATGCVDRVASLSDIPSAIMAGFDALVAVSR